MMTAREKKQQEKIVKLQDELEKSKKNIKSLEGKLLTKERKCQLLEEENKKKQKFGTISLQPVKRHKYSEFIVSLSVQLYVKTGCGFRGVVTIISILNELLGWKLKAIPSYNSIENWLKKSGLSIYKEPEKKITEEDYALIVDESMMIGSQKLLLTLGVKAAHAGKPVSHGDVEVLGMNVRSSWNGEAVCKELETVSKRLPHPPLYVVSDNASVLNKGIREFKSLHIRDVSHTLGMLMERVYSKDEEFNAFMKALALVKFREIMNPVAYLLPPKQRTIARFMNLTRVVEWADKMLNNYNKLTVNEREIFSFIPKYASFIEELQTVLACVNAIEHELKHKGLSHQSFRNCMTQMKHSLFFGNERMLKIATQIIGYMRDEIKKLPSPNTFWNASSDIIESIFGVYKTRKATNPLHGVTPFVLLLPLHTRIGKKDGIVPFDFKRSLESVFMSDIDSWRKEQLLDNMVYKRIKTLKVA